MPKPPNKFLRVFVPVLLLLFAIGVGWAVAVNTARKTKPAETTLAAGQPAATEGTKAPEPAPAPPTPATPTGTAPATTPATPPAAAAGTPTNPPAPPTSPTAAATPATGLTAKVISGEGAAKVFDPIGSLERDAAGKVTTSYQMRLMFSPIGAGIESLELSRHFTELGAAAPNESLQHTASLPVTVIDAAGNSVTRERLLVPMAMYGVTINGQYVSLAGAAGAPVWRQVAPGHFEATIVDAEGREVARVHRAYVLQPERYSLVLDQTLENVTAAPLTVVWHQAGPIDLPTGVIRYGGDTRRVRMGYLPPAAINPDGQFVETSRYLLPHATLLGEPLTADGSSWADVQLWPQADTAAENLPLAWAALTNRYFAVAISSLPERQAKHADGTPDKAFHFAKVVDRVVLGRPEPSKAEILKSAVAVLRLESPAYAVAPGAKLDASMGIYAGPNTRKILDHDPQTNSVGLGGLMVFTFGGPCGFCTFQWIAYTLRAYLGLLHDYVLFDWALAIIVMVLTVRTLLHPITKWSQTSLQRFGKQMQKLAPKQAKLKERYGDDPKRLREETAKLMQEEKINYAGALGCLPMFLQTPIWIAVYAMIFFTFELRHEGAFFGVFQTLSGGKWAFLADLSEPDHFIPLGTSISVPGLSSIMGPIDSINLLPFLLGMVFFIQQKYLTPPPAAPLSPEMETQQKITKVMIVVLFPLMMYNAPSALALYFIANSTLGILESKHIRKHVDALDAAREEREKAMGPAARRVTNLADKNVPAPTGFMGRLRAELQRRMEAAQKMKAEQEKLKRRGRAGPR